MGAAKTVKKKMTTANLKLSPFWWANSTMPSAMKIVLSLSKETSKEQLEWLSLKNSESIKFLLFNLPSVEFKMEEISVKLTSKKLEKNFVKE